MARPSYNDAIALGAIDVVSDRMEPTAARAVILQAFRER
jgi:hypothetical protein